MKNTVFILLLALCLTSVAVAGTQGGSPVSPSTSLPAAAAAKDAKSVLLPPVFNGWQKSAAGGQASTDAAVADPADGPVLKEYGFTDLELATYTRGDRSMRVKAARFRDATGAFGAYSYYLQPQMQTETIGDEGVSNRLRVLFHRGNVLVDVTLDRVTAMSATDLRALADLLPAARGSAAVLPSLPGNLPRQSSIAHSGRFIIGPVALERLGLAIPASLVDFNKSAEVSYARYNSSYGEANLALIGYPTPQIAAERMRAIQSANLPGGPFKFKRSGPIVAIVGGQIPPSEAQALLDSVNYDAEVTWNQPTKPNSEAERARFMIALITLTGMILMFSLVSGIAFGGIRLLAKRLYPNRVFDRPEDVELIRLDLK